MSKISYFVAIDEQNKYSVQDVSSERRDLPSCSRTNDLAMTESKLSHILNLDPGGATSQDSITFFTR